MSDISKIKINDTTYNIKDANALTDAPSNGEEYVRKNGNWAISSVGSGGGGAMSAMYYYEQTVNVASNSEIMRITDSRINTNSIVLECTFADPSYISDDVTWTSYAGYMAFTGTCKIATTANVTIGYTTSDNFSDRLMTLLWENPNPNSNFADQSLSLDFSNYDFIIIETKMGFNSDSSINDEYLRYKVNSTISKGSEFTIVMLLGAQASLSNANKYSKARRVNFTDSSIHFSDCISRQWNVTGPNFGTGESQNCFVIPLKIYGISRYNYFEEKKKKPDLIYSGSPAASSTNNLITGKKFSDYDMLYVVIGNASNYFNMTIMMDDFVKVNNEAKYWWIDNNSNAIWDCNISWITDTSFGVGTKGSYVTFMKIYGIS